MFAGRRRQSSTIRTMQLFYDLKQKFPTLPDQVVFECIKSTVPEDLPQDLVPLKAQLAEAAASAFHEQMGRPPLQPPPSLDLAMTEKNNSDINQNIVPSTAPKRPDNLPLKLDHPLTPIQLSNKCKNVHQLLNTPNKPPIKPKQKKETCSTPTQTTDTLNSVVSSPLNVSLAVNCSMDLVQTPSKKKSVVQLTPCQPWLFDQAASQPSRSYNSVNFVVRPPSSEHQAPIDITSQNSSLTYSTSSFDSKNGLQSRLQITVGPAGSTNVSAARVRPKSCYELLTPLAEMELVTNEPPRAGSFHDLNQQVTEPIPAPVIMQQQARMNNLSIEIKTSKLRLKAMRQEIAQLEEDSKESIANEQLEHQLIKEVKHLQYQCTQLATKQNGDFYGGLYTGQRDPIRTQEMHRYSYQQQSTTTSSSPQANMTSQEWDCHMCTFRNHPDLNKCEGCEMPRIHHVCAAPGENILIHVTPRMSKLSGITQSWVL